MSVSWEQSGHETVQRDLEAVVEILAEHRGLRGTALESAVRTAHKLMADAAWAADPLIVGAFAVKSTCERLAELKRVAGMSRGEVRK